MQQEEMTSVVMLTKYYRVEGEIALLPGSRLTDFMEAAGEFVAVTKATVFNLAKGKRVLAGGFLNVRRDSVEVIMPAAEVSMDSV